MIPPPKPFDSYKWRWGEVVPSENLNRPEIYLGVLRALRRFEGSYPTDPGLLDALDVVAKETKSPVDLRRKKPERNLLRYFGQYWKALDLLAETQPIQLTDFGRRVADGGVTRDEFAAATIKSLELPNIRTEANPAQWGALRIRPLSLILEIMQNLAAVFGLKEGFLTRDELVRVVIPLAGSLAPMPEYVQSLREYRDGTLDLNGWPNCAPESNDPRMAREFLLFLHYYGITTIVGKSRATQRFLLEEPALATVENFNAIQINASAPDAALQALRNVSAAEIVPREIITAKIRARPQQARFRKDVLSVWGCCAITGEKLQDALEAAHLIPVEEGGQDTVGNGIMLRADIHRLFDAGHIRIKKDGTIHLSEQMAASATYSALPQQVNLPAHISAQCIEWRWRYE
jgi:hypothetical protein